MACRTTISHSLTLLSDGKKIVIFVSVFSDTVSMVMTSVSTTMSVLQSDISSQAGELISKLFRTITPALLI